MKKSIITLSFFFVCSTIVFGQNDYNILEQQLPFNKYATSFSTNIIGVNEYFVIYNWQKFIEKHKGITYLISYGEGDVEFESNHVALPFLNNQEVNLHTRISPNKGESGVLLTIWIQMPDGKYYSYKNDKDSVKKIKQWLLQFDEQLQDKNNAFRE